MTAADVAKRCSCGPCRKQVERAAEAYATERALALLKAVRDFAGDPDGVKKALAAWGAEA